MGMAVMCILTLSMLLILLAAGYPIAFAMGTVVVAGILAWFDPALLFQLVQISMDMSTSFLFLVAPLFVLMAELIVASGMADDAFSAARKWFNWLPGGLAISSIFACTVFAAVSGSSPLTAATIGMVAIPGMSERGYSKKLAAGVVATAGTIGIMIPPSLCMIIYGLLSGTSIGKLFIAGIVPGLVLTLALVVTVIILVKINPAIAPIHEEKISWKERFVSLKRVGPILTLCIFVLGSIYAGIATPSEAAAVGASGAFIALMIIEKCNFKKLKPALVRSAGICCAIMFLMIGGNFMAFLLTYIGLPEALLEFMLDLGVGRWGVMILINMVLVFLGCFLDPTAILVLSVPLVFPIITSLGFDPVWFGVIMTLNVEIGMVTPPVGLNLYVLKAIDPDLDIDVVILGAMPFLFALVLCMVLFMVFPQISLWLPNLMQ
jgi:C4-dicarboxylate transporter, DctM subunit